MIRLQSKSRRSGVVHERPGPPVPDGPVHAIHPERGDVALCGHRDLTPLPPVPSFEALPGFRTKRTECRELSGHAMLPR
ncbi:hypothetical protein FraQA3DRAFT_0058 [Frankia sp. QA3]|nr:hypothetical protein FraQA3DRAFT_0058 [Frankia sp. QA3]